MPLKFWWPTALAAQLILIQNFLAKIGLYAAALPLTPAQVTAAEDICQQFIDAFNITEQSRQTMTATTAWRNEVFLGTPTGSNASPQPEFAPADPKPYTRGIVTQFFELRDLIVASPGYTDAIGENLGIVGTQKTSKPADEVTPMLKPTTSAGYNVSVSGSMQGMDAVRIEYARKGGSFQPIAFLTNMPGGFQITPATPGEPESGQLRAVFIRKNEEYGNYSANYPITLS